MSTKIAVGAQLQDTIRKLTLVSPGAMSRGIDSQLIPIVTNAKEKWPKKTGISAGALRIRIENENYRIVKYVQDLIPYAGAVHPKDTEELSADTLVFDPIAEALEPMLGAYARELARI